MHLARIRHRRKSPTLQRASAFKLHLRLTMDGGHTSSPIPASGAAAKSSRSALLIVVVLAVGALGGWAWFNQQRGHADETVRPGQTSGAPKYIAHLDGFTVNLADAEETHFLRVTIDLGLDRLPEGADKTKPAQSLPVARIRDTTLSVLAACKADELLTPEGKLQLKKNLLDALNRSVPELNIREIYFTEFLVQR